MNAAPVSAAKQAALRARMQALGIREADLAETFIRGAGRGGQKLNKTSSCVRLQHAASGIMVKCGQSRSRELNRFLARRRLCERLETYQLGARIERQQAVARCRRQKRRPSHRQEAQRLADKHHQAQKKQRRSAPGPDD